MIETALALQGVAFVACVLAGQPALACFLLPPMLATWNARREAQEIHRGVVAVEAEVQRVTAVIRLLNPPAPLPPQISIATAREILGLDPVDTPL